MLIKYISIVLLGLMAVLVLSGFSQTSIALPAAGASSPIVTWDGIYLPSADVTTFAKVSLLSEAVVTNGDYQLAHAYDVNQALLEASSASTFSSDYQLAHAFDMDQALAEASESSLLSRNYQLAHAFDMAQALAEASGANSVDPLQEQLSYLNQ